ncbi:hypothetical protein CFOL_v3_26940 [Cephalotus follicularis]|uniref:Golgin candidate 2 n=1 Tax=Cephalotus follicularis TaxID=3775 RepID=A0A1Q3CTU2_CEPFO|nr:hypothetical protein CFOL_v3_26940 [Cephalotus follicularis]
MANWISSKLKVAETFLQQIDQQAAESLGKSERPPRSDELKLDRPTKAYTGGGTLSVPLKDQLKKKTQYNDKEKEMNGSINNNKKNNLDTSNSKSSTKLTDSDWTELLSSSPPNPPTNSGNRRKDGRRLPKNTCNNNATKSARSSNFNFNGKPSDVGVEKEGEASSSSGTFGSHSSGNLSQGRVLDALLVKKPKDDGNEENAGLLDSKNHPPEKVDEVSDVKVGVNDVHGRLSASGRGKFGSNAVYASSVFDDLNRTSSFTSDGSADSDSGSGSSSDSESEREREERRKRRERILAEKAAAKAVEVIKERENLVAKLEGEKQSIEKILEERAKQHAQEASQLQTTMIEMMEAAELEKQKHNNTRMEAIARLSKLETANADLARSLASKQKNLEAKIDRVAELRQQIELKEVVHGELRRRISSTHQSGISSTHQSGTHLNQLAAGKKVEYEREILAVEYSFITNKIERLQDKAKKLVTNIEMTRKEIEDPTEVEIELKQRLGQLTDHLIQKQAQVEALSSEKATILFRIEALSRLLDENKSSMNEFSSTTSRDLETGMLEFTNSKLRSLIEERIHSGRKHLGSLLQLLDFVFLAGAVFLRRNSAAKLWSLVYLVCLHLWVIYILMSHSQPSEEVRSGAVISLETINNTAGIMAGDVFRASISHCDGYGEVW